MTEQKISPITGGFSPPDINDEDIAEVVSALKSGWITTGPKTKEFERELAGYCGTSKAVCLNSNTACAEMTLRLLGIGPGDEVMVPAYTYTASASVIAHVGAKIVMVDSQPDSLEMDYDKVEESITDKTKVIIPVDLGGVVCDYDGIYGIVEKKKALFKPSNDIQKVFGRIIVMADGAHSLGAEYYGNRTGAIADFTNFSFHAVKNLTTAEGGAVTWKDRKGLDNEQIYHHYQLLSLHGQSKDALAKDKLGAWEYDIVEPYFKCNMTDVHAAIGLSQLRRYHRLIERRHEIIKKYDEALLPLGFTTLKHSCRNSKSSGHLYITRLPEKYGISRDDFITKLAELGVPTNVHYKPLPLHSAYKKLGFDIKDYPNAYNFYKNEVTLPLHTKLSDDQVAYVITSIKKVLGL
ncbi:MAG: DegT/DnrJ/EryC1/StrS family aminotransferase [Candidatus Riflebacteria bacterium]|nr:DegT/DnrJ/EryC1/StrS family aminotransferase [Candidatus Riflebacteria bacterium]